MHGHETFALRDAHSPLANSLMEKEGISPRLANTSIEQPPEGASLVGRVATARPLGGESIRSVDSLSWPLFPWFPPWTHIILVVNGIILIALLIASMRAKMKGDFARGQFYRQLLLWAVVVTVGGNLLFLGTFVAPPSFIASEFGGIFTIGSLAPLAVWGVPFLVLVDHIARRSRSR